MAKAASKSTKKASAKAGGSYGGGIIRPLYAAPINEAAASGDLQAMKSIATKARKHLSDVNSALAKLDAAIAKSKG